MKFYIFFIYYLCKNNKNLFNSIDVKALKVINLNNENIIKLKSFHNKIYYLI